MEQKFINDDCMKHLKNYPDNYFDIAIVDPPYFSGPEKRKFYGRKTSPIGVQRIYKETMFKVVGQPIKISEIEDFKYMKVDFAVGIF